MPELDIVGDIAEDPSVNLTDTNIQLDSIDPATLTPVTLNETALTLPEMPAPADGTPPAAVAAAATANGTSTTNQVLSSVGSYLTTGGGLNALLGVGTAVLKAQTAGAQLATAQTVLQTQMARVAAGYRPAAIGYTVNPQTGLPIPVLSTPGGTQPLSSPLLDALTRQSAAGVQVQSFLAQYGLWILGGVLVLALSRR